MCGKWEKNEKLFFEWKVKIEPSEFIQVSRIHLALRAACSEPSTSQNHLGCCFSRLVMNETHWKCNFFLLFLNLIFNTRIRVSFSNETWTASNSTAVHHRTVIHSVECTAWHGGVIESHIWTRCEVAEKKCCRRQNSNLKLIVHRLASKLPQYINSFRLVSCGRQKQCKEEAVV